MQVNLIVAGFMKSGSSSIARHLESHPEICFSRSKEPNFFNYGIAKGKNQDDYHSMFPYTGEPVVAEASVSYSRDTLIYKTHKRIHNYNPATRLLFVMRNPIERIISQYMFFQWYGFAQYNNFFDEMMHNITYLHTSRYYTRLKPFLDTFPDAQIKLLFFEDFTSDKKQFFTTLADFLQIAPNQFSFNEIRVKQSNNKQVPRKQTINKIRKHRIFPLLYNLTPGFIREGIKRKTHRTNVKPGVSPVMFDFLLHELIDDIEAIEKLTGRDLTHWKLYETLQK